MALRLQFTQLQFTQLQMRFCTAQLTAGHQHHPNDVPSPGKNKTSGGFSVTLPPMHVG